METIIKKVDPNNIDMNIIKQAANIIKKGGLVVFPTETVYGIGADALNEQAVKKIFKAKGRPQDNPLIVHIKDMEQLSDLVNEVPEKAQLLAEKYWPGPFTMLFKKKEIIPNIVTAGLNTVAIRMPKNNIALSIIKESGKPIAAPSANISGKPSTTEVSHVIDDFNGKVDMIIDGGNSKIGLESTVIDVLNSPPTILRPGGITLEDFLKILKNVIYDPGLEYNKNQIPKCPGQKYRHYSPNALVELYKGNLSKIIHKINKNSKKYVNEGKKIGILATSQTKKFYENGIIINVGDRTNLLTISSNLFSTLRQFDHLGVEIILAEAVTENGVGKAIMNRLEKAASKIIEID